MFDLKIVNVIDQCLDEGHRTRELPLDGETVHRIKVKGSHQNASRWTTARLNTATLHHRSGSYMPQSRMCDAAKTSSF